MTWWKPLLRRNRMEERLEKELRFHLEEHTAGLIERGYDPREARRLARLAFGGPEQVKEECRDARGTRWLEDFFQDVRYALRTLRQRPGFATVALLTLALGTGATTVMFTLVNAVLLKPFAYRDPSGLLSLQEQTDWSTAQGNTWAFTYPNYLDCKRESRSLDMAAWNRDNGTVSAPGPAEYVAGYEISSELFPLLGVNVKVGRAFLPAEDRPGGSPVAIISHGFWQRRFAGNPSAIGSGLIFDGRPYTIVGVMPAAFRLEDDSELDIFTPLGQDTSPRMENRASHGFQVWARLRPGAILAQARNELAVVGGRLAAQYPDSNRGRTFIAEPLRPDVGDTRSALWLLLGAVSLVLLIACANVASLLLARAVSRERELAMRVALGAGRGRLARQCLTESAVLALAGGALGVLLAAAGIRPFAEFWPGGLPRGQEVQLDWRVLLFASTVSLASGLLFGLAPALRAPARDLEQTLRAAARTVTGSARHLRSFVISEIAIAMVLLVSAGMLGRSLLRLSSLDPGVNIRNVVTARTALSPATLANPGRTRAAWQDILDRGRRILGVEAIAMVDTVPMRAGSNVIGYSLSAAAINAACCGIAAPQDQQRFVLANSVTPDYLKVTGIPLRRGRFLTDDDRQGASSVAVIDDVMGQQAFPGQDPIGKHLWLGIGPDPVIVVGIVGHVRQWGLAADDQAPVRAQLYYPFAQVPDPLVRRWSELMSLAVRTRVDPLSVVEPLRREVRGASGDQVIYQIRTFEQLASASLARQRFLLMLFGGFAALALLLACIGIYGVLAYLTSRRVPEIGVRMALGASAPEVIWLVLRQSLVMILAGIGVGALAGLAAARVLISSVEGVRSTEPLTFGFMISVLTVAALFASFLPARRASHIDPIKALRQE